MLALRLSRRLRLHLSNPVHGPGGGNRKIGDHSGSSATSEALAVSPGPHRPSVRLPQIRSLRDLRLAVEDWRTFGYMSQIGSSPWRRLSASRTSASVRESVAALAGLTVQHGGVQQSRCPQIPPEAVSADFGGEGAGRQRPSAGAIRGGATADGSPSPPRRLPQLCVLQRC